MAERRRKKRSRRDRRSRPDPVGKPGRAGQAAEVAKSIDRGAVARKSRNRPEAPAQAAGPEPTTTTTDTPGLALGELSHVARDLVRILALAAFILVLLVVATVALG